MTDRRFDQSGINHTWGYAMKYVQMLFSTLLHLMLLIFSFGCSKDYTPTSYRFPFPAAADTIGGIRNPFWTKDGSKIIGIGHVFGREGDDFYEIAPSGGQPRRIYRDSLEKDMPILSPDGRSIAYLAAQMGRIYSRAHVWIVTLTGTAARDLTPSGGNWENLRWSPDSRYVVFDGGVEDSGAVNYQIAKATVQSADLKMMTRSSRFGNRDPVYVANGNRIAFSSNRIQTDYGGKVWLMDDDGSNPVPIDTTRTASVYPRPSPARSDLVFSWGLGGEADAGTYTINLDSVILPAQPGSFQPVYPHAELNIMAWSPDGNWILLPIETSSDSKDLFLMNRTGGMMRRLTTGYYVYLFSYPWSPDSRYLVFTASDDHNTTIHSFTYDLNTSKLTKLILTHK